MLHLSENDGHGTVGSVAKSLKCLWPAGFPCSLACDPWLTGYHFVGKLSAMGESTKPTQHSIPLESVNEYSIIHAFT